MKLTIEIPDDILATWLALQNWTPETGCPTELERYSDERSKNPAIGEYQPCTAEDMVLWEIEHHFAGTAYSRIRQLEGAAGVDKVRADDKFKTVFYVPDLRVKESVSER